MEQKWLSWPKKLQAIAQAGLEYSVEILNEYTERSNKIK